MTKPKVVPMKDPVVRVEHDNHPQYGACIIYIRKSKVKYGS
jgi:hypothetical protein